MIVYLLHMAPDMPPLVCHSLRKGPCSSPYPEHALFGRGNGKCNTWCGRGCPPQYCFLNPHCRHCWHCSCLTADFGHCCFVLIPVARYLEKARQNRHIIYLTENNLCNDTKINWAISVAHIFYLKPKADQFPALTQSGLISQSWAPQHHLPPSLPAFLCSQSICQAWPLFCKGLLPPFFILKVFNSAQTFRKLAEG